MNGSQEMTGLVIVSIMQICGESNATVFREAAKAGVARAAFISVADLKLPGKLCLNLKPAKHTMA